jgi:RecJ-like exonuclease
MTSLKGLGEAKDLVNDLDKTASVFLVSHDDADGLTAGSITYRTILREGFTPQLRCLKRLDREFIEAASKIQQDLIIFSDTGSGQLENLEKYILEKTKVIVLDHHETTELEHENLVHVNPHLSGIDGAREVSGAGVSYFFAKEVNGKNKDLAHLALIGALGDMQDTPEGLTGPNKEILNDAIEENLVELEKDLRFFGRQTRPLYKAIEYTTEPFIPTLSGNESACVQFLSDIGIPLKKKGKPLRLVDLSGEERKKLTTELILKMIENKIDVKTAETIVGDVFTVLAEEEGTQLRDAKEFTSLLNACGRYEKYGIGVGICLGDRGVILENALSLLEENKKYISQCYDWINKNMDRVEDKGDFYSFHAHNELNDTVVGTVASMLVSSRMLKPTKTVIGFADSDDEIKVSGRSTNEFVKRGVNLGHALLYAAEKTGGEGGGHDIAAGAQVKPGKEDEFLKYVAEKIGEQLNETSG